MKKIKETLEQLAGVTGDIYYRSFTELDELSWLNRRLQEFRLRTAFPPRSLTESVSVDTAVGLLGEENVIMPNTVAELWNKHILLRQKSRFGFKTEIIEPPEEIFIPYRTADLIETLEVSQVIGEDIERKLRWVLIYDPGFSVPESIEIFGDNGLFGEPSFELNFGYNLLPSDRQPRGFKFICLTEIYAGSNNASQKRKIYYEWGDDSFTKTPTAAFVNASLTMFLKEGRFPIMHHLGRDDEDIVGTDPWDRIKRRDYGPQLIINSPDTARVILGYTHRSDYNYGTCLMRKLVFDSTKNIR